MSNPLSLTSIFTASAQALGVHSTAMQVTAHNIANVSTDKFVPQRATLATGSGGDGVELQSVRKIQSAFSANESKNPNMYIPSETSLEREFPHMILIQRNFEANAKVISVADEMFGTLFDNHI